MPFYHRFLRGKIVDKARYDLWKDQSQNRNANDETEMDTQIETMSFRIEDDDEDTQIVSHGGDMKKSDKVSLIVNIT